MKTLISTLAIAAAFAAFTPVAHAHDHTAAHDTAPAPSGVKATLVYQHAIPDVPGKSVKGVLVEYQPGGSNGSHVHARSALIYATVIQGAVVSQVNGGEIRTFKTGENFTELPGDFHNISANASKTEPAKLLAVFIVDTDDAVLTTPAKQN
jgi:quercetin dioxygenase-like cupin family protein